jgi:predicted phosphodiesterase
MVRKIRLAIGLLIGLSITTNELMAAQITFAAIGDYGRNTSAEKTVASLVKKHNPEFIITLGDNNYPKGCWSSIDTNIGKYYHRFIYRYKGKQGEGSESLRFYPSLGNHDWAAAQSCLHHGVLPYLAYFSLPGNQRYYDFVKGPVHFFALDSDYREPDGNAIGSKQYDWFLERIQASTAPFKVVYFHVPPYSSGRHGSNTTLQWDFAAQGVDLVLTGHDHIYERIERDGIIYIVNGLGGAGRTQFSKNLVQGSQRQYSNHNGFLLINANDHSMSVQFINDRNKVRDEFVLSK